jgi:histidinol-phosphate aminotransferase
MRLSRRAFVRALTPAHPESEAGRLIAARGREAHEAESWTQQHAAAAPIGDGIYINSNENPLGPGKAALAAIDASFAEAGRYPMNARPAMADLTALVAKAYNVKQDHVVLGNGSSELLRAAVRAFTSRERPLVTAAPSFELPHRTADLIGTPVKALPVDAGGRLDLDAMAAAARGAGLVFVCNPNNPTATVHGDAAIRDFVSLVRRDSPDTTILLDEAYHDYVTDPAYATGAPLATQLPHVFVTRTFSKAYGMAGLRVGYAVGQVETIKALGRYLMPFNINVPGLAAASVSFQDPPHIQRERERNTEVRRFTMDFLRNAGLRPTESQGNFVFVDVRRPAREFREACQKHGVVIGREFPPLDRTHVRISLGTMDEMRRATQVFAKLLGAAAPSSAV